MKILVCIKQTVDTATRIKLLENKQGIDESHVEWIINPYDEFALEEALQIQEKAPPTEVIALSVGPKRVEKALKTALAMGADRAIWIEPAPLAKPNTEGSASTLAKPSNLEDSSNQKTYPAFVAGALASTIQKEEKHWDLILMGKTGGDENHSATGPMLAELLNIPHVGFVKSLKKLENGKWQSTRQNDGATEEILFQPPALVTVEKGINTPRYPTLPGIMRAKKKPIKKISYALEGQPHYPPLGEKAGAGAEANPAQQKVVFHSYSYPLPQPPVEWISGTAPEQAQKLVTLLKQKNLI